MATFSISKLVATLAVCAAIVNGVAVPPPGPVPASCNVATAGADYKYAPGLVFPSTPKYPHGFRTVDSPADCCAMCQTLANCSFWTYETTTPAKPTCYSLDGACCFLRTAAAYGGGSTNPGATGGSTEPLPAFDFNNPKIHQSPDCVHEGGWHDMAGALTFKGVHHSFQGCPASGGWSHSSSTDLVHWKDEGRGVHILQENYEGMSSRDSPCSGFVTVDDAGTPCAGFRQCGSSQGTTGLNPAAHSWDVPMELRCAENDKLTNWSAPIWIYPVYFYRHLPYDPVRPWKDYDGKWYSAWSTDGCNSTTKAIPCAAGGQLEILTSPSLHGAGMDWKQLEPMFTTNTTMSGMQKSVGAITAEFVTAGYFGGVPGDPDGGTTRVVTQNRGGATYWVGKQANGSKFVPYWDSVGAVGHYDYGSLTMARTLGSDPNQVAINGRRVLVGWIGGWTGASQSLARDLSLSSTHELLQAFVPELETLRVPASLTTTDFVGTDETAEVGIPHADGSMQLEVVATFEWTGATPPTKPFGVSFLNGTRTIMIDCAGNDPQAPKGCMVRSDGDFPNVFGGNSGSGPLMPIGQKSATVHTIVDHTIYETIVNNRTAIVAYSPMTKDPPGTAVRLVGVPAGVTGTISSWNLKAANNAGPQP